MRRNVIVGTAALALVGAGAAAATVAGSDDAVTAPAVQQVRIELDQRGAGEPGVVRATNRPEIVYLQGSGTIDPAIGPYADVTLSSRACRGKERRLLDGGAAADNTDVYQQGSYVRPRKGEYHVLLGFDGDAGEAPVAYNVVTHLICAKGVR